MAKILVVEDERVAAWSIQESLEGFGHTIVANVMSGSEAIASAVETHPDLVLMDIQLEGKIDGIAAAEQIRDRLRIPIIYLTAHADPHTLKRAIATEAFGYLIKPFNQAELHTTIEIALLRNQFEQRLAAIEQRLSTTLTNIGDGTIATDVTGKVVFMNPVAEDLTGWQQADALGRDADSILDLVNADTGEAVESPIMQAIQEGRRVSSPERCVLRMVLNERWERVLRRFGIAMAMSRVAWWCFRTLAIASGSNCSLNNKSKNAPSNFNKP
jgi:PAS domain S-box-containing protein